MIRPILLFVAQVALMAYMCLLQFVPRKIRRYFPFGKFNFLSNESSVCMDLSDRVAIVTGANSGVGLVMMWAGCTGTVASRVP